MCKPAEGPVKIKMERTPFILRPWIALYRASPKLCVPGTDIDVAFSLLSAVLLAALRLSLRCALYAAGWPVGSPDTYYASACAVSIVHSSLMIPGTAAALLSREYVPSGRMAGSPRWYRDATTALIGFCTGYMLHDSVMGYLVETWRPGVGPVLSVEDWQFLVHHVLTTLYMLSVRWMGAGHMSCMILIFNGEFTAPLMNLMLIMEKAMAQPSCAWMGPWLPTAYAYTEQLFSLLYLVCRVLISPAVIAHISYSLLFTKRGRTEFPLWLSICLMPTIWGVQFGSIPWILTCMETLKRGPEIGSIHAEL